MRLVQTVEAEDCNKELQFGETRCEIMIKTEICIPRFYPAIHLANTVGTFGFLSKVKFNEGTFKESSKLLFHYCVTQLIRMNMSGSI